MDRARHLLKSPPSTRHYYCPRPIYISTHSEGCLPASGGSLAMTGKSDVFINRTHIIQCGTFRVGQSTHPPTCPSGDGHPLSDVNPHWMGAWGGVRPREWGAPPAGGGGPNCGVAGGTKKTVSQRCACIEYVLRIL